MLKKTLTFQHLKKVMHAILLKSWEYRNGPGDKAMFMVPDSVTRIMICGPKQNMNNKEWALEQHLHAYFMESVLDNYAPLFMIFRIDLIGG
jgi:hypothetical protein